jgi:hypothetical protein
VSSARLMRQGGNRDTGERAGPSAENCPHCKHELSDAWIKAAHSRVAGRQGGRPRVLRLCPYCREKFGGRELREHMPRCDKRPTHSVSPADPAKPVLMKQRRATSPRRARS